MRSGTLALVGKPNVGKSTLLNQLIGEKISITSRKAQTTRATILGVLTTNNAQFVFMDTPGFQNRFQNALYRRMNQNVKNTLVEVDVVIFIIEADTFDEKDSALLPYLPKEKPVILAINKIDRLKNKNTLLPFIKKCQEHFNFATIVPIAAISQKESAPLLKVAQTFLPHDFLFFEESTITDKSMRFLAAEFIREKIFRFLGDELPYGCAVEIEKFEETEKLARIFAAVWVERDNHKAMLIGKNGNKLKHIATTARRDLERLFGIKVYLEVWVKVKHGWADNAALLKSLTQI